MWSVKGSPVLVLGAGVMLEWPREEQDANGRKKEERLTLKMSER